MCYLTCSKERSVSLGSTLCGATKLASRELHGVLTDTLLRSLRSPTWLKVLWRIVRVGVTWEGNDGGSRQFSHLTQIAICEYESEAFPRGMRLERLEGGNRSSTGEFDSRDVETGGRGTTIAVEVGQTERELES